MFFSALEKCPGRAEMCAGFPFFVPSAPPCATSWTKEDLIIPPSHGLSGATGLDTPVILPVHGFPCQGNRNSPGAIFF